MSTQAPTPESDEAARKGAYLTAGAYPETCGKQLVHLEVARKLERERDEARAALSGRTVSCSQCNEMAKKLEEAQDEIKAVKDVLWPNQTGLPNEHRNAAVAVDAIKRLSERQIAAQAAQIAQLREALEVFCEGSPWADNGDGCATVDCLMADLHKASCALSSPPPQVVPLEDVRPLVEALRHSYDATNWPADGSSMQEEALAAFTTKHPLP